MAEVLAACDGEITGIQNGKDGAGNTLGIVTLYNKKHNITCRYLHCKADSDKIKVGSMVKKGQSILEQGKTGTDHVHLHFEIHPGNVALGAKSTKLDPITYIPELLIWLDQTPRQHGPSPGPKTMQLSYDAKKLFSQRYINDGKQDNLQKAFLLLKERGREGEIPTVTKRVLCENGLGDDAFCASTVVQTAQTTTTPSTSTPTPSPGSYKAIETESFLLGGGIDGSNIPDEAKYCPSMKNILDEEIVRSKSIMNAHGSKIKGKKSFIAKLETAFTSFKNAGYVLTSAPVGDSYRSFNSQRKGHINILNARKLWEEGKPWSKNGKVRTPDGPSGNNKPPWVADPCKGYHTQGQAIDLDQEGSYTKDGVKTTFESDIKNYGPLYSALYDSGVRRISNEWWHWSVGETDHPKGTPSIVGNEPSTPGDSHEKK